MVSGDAVIYGGFWRRLAAGLVDFAIMAPIAALWYMLQRQAQSLALFLVVPQLALMSWYFVYLVVRFGGSPGKLITGLRITMLDGSPVTAHAASLRYSVDFVFGLIGTLVFALAILKLPAASFYALNFGDWREALEPHLPAWHETFRLVMTIWIWGELLILLTNRKRRALHDFIAGTVVVHRLEQATTDGFPRRTPLPHAQA